MSAADWLLAAGAIPVVYAAYWMLAGAFVLGANGRKATVSLSVGGSYIVIVLLLLLASLVGTVLTITS